MDIDKIASSSSLITPELEGQMQGVFEKLEGEAGLVCVIDPEDAVSVEMAELVRHISGLTGKLSCRIYDKTEAEEKRRNWILLFCLLPGCTGRNSMPAFRFTESPEGRK